MATPLNPFWEYWVDAVQRSAMFMDVLRQRGDEVQRHWAAGNPPVLVFPYETVIEGKTLERPVNYALLRIIPDAQTPVDPRKRPIFIVDPAPATGRASAAPSSTPRSASPCAPATPSTSSPSTPRPSPARLSPTSAAPRPCSSRK